MTARGPDDAEGTARATELERIGLANAQAWEFWQASGSAPSSWVAGYLVERGLDTSVVPAHAPPGWTTTLDHLRAAGMTDSDLIAGGLATRASTGRLIDRFRDRLVFPIYDDAGRIAGFTARANPAEIAQRPDTPKYLNTATTIAFSKSHLLYGLSPDAADRIAHGATPVMVEGPIDAAAIDTLGLDVVPLAACGTAVTTDHLATIDGALDRLVVAFDADTAGRAATYRLWRLLGPERAGLARQAMWNGAKDPGELIETGRASTLAAALVHPRPLSVAVVENHAASSIHALENVEGQVYLTRAVARDVAPTANPQAITAAIDALIGLLGPEAHLESWTIRDEFAYALRPGVDAAIATTPDALEVSTAPDLAEPSVPHYLLGHHT